MVLVLDKRGLRVGGFRGEVLVLDKRGFRVDGFRDGVLVLGLGVGYQSQ